MNPVISFLTALGQAFSALTLYGDTHPMRTAAMARLLQALLQLLEGGVPLRLSFIDNEVIVGSRPLTELRGWEWGARLAAVGIQRLEIAVEPLPRSDDVTALMAAMRARIVSPVSAPAIWSQHGIRIGPLSVGGGDGGGGAAGQDGGDARSRDAGVVLMSVVDAIATSGMADEISAVDHIHDEVGSGRHVPMAEVEGVVRSLALTICREQGSLLPLLQIRDVDEYTSAHCCNVSMLSMGVSDQLGLSGADTRAIGTAALLHDIGKVRLPKDVLTKPGKLTDAERALIQSHPVEGARILTGRGLGHGLAATVAYEHHIWFNGRGGYPHFTYPRTTHYASRIVHVSDIYDALCSTRPYRAAWPRERALELLQSLSGVELDPDVTAAFIAMARSTPEVRIATREPLGLT